MMKQCVLSMLNNDSIHRILESLYRARGIHERGKVAGRSKICPGRLLQSRGEQGLCRRRKSPGRLCRTCDCVLEGCGSWPWLTGGQLGICFLLHQFVILHFHLCECLFALGEIFANSWLKMKVLRRFQNGSDFFGVFLTTCFRKEESTEKDV